MNANFVQSEYPGKKGNKVIYWKYKPEMSKEEWQRKNKSNWDAHEEENGRVRLIEVKN